MGRFFSAVAVIATVCLAGILAGCSSSQPVTTAVDTGPVAAIITLSPQPTANLEAGSTLSFTGAAQSEQATAITGETVSYQSSNTAVLTISTAGVACGGTWNSLTAPTVCTPGPVGTAQVTATANGVTSPPTTVYVHQHIDSVSVGPAPNQNPPTASCFSTGNTVAGIGPQSFIYQATAFSHGADITSTVGPVTWQVVNPGAATLKTATTTAPIAGLLPGQTQVTAATPGLTNIFANIDGTTSSPLPFTTCPVQSITLSLDNGGGTSANILSATPAAISADIVDTRGIHITGSFLTWCSSDPGSVAVGATNCAAGASSHMTATGQAVGGGASIIASCTPPSCNAGLTPARPVYPAQPVTLTVSSSAGTAASSAATYWIASTGCGTLDGCISRVGLVTSTNGSGNTPANALAIQATLPSTPNSLVFDPKASRLYLGTDRGDLGTKGLMVLNPSDGTVAQYTSVVGKVLAVSPDGTVAVISDARSTPNQVYIFNCAGTGACSATTTTTLNITGATAAAFSPDGLKAFIVAGNNLYVYSAISALQTVPLASPANAISFLADGAFAYLTGGAATITPRRTCDATIANDINGVAQTLTSPGIPAFLKALPDGVHLLAVDSPGIDIVNVTNIQTSNPIPTAADMTSPGCNPESGAPPTPPVLSNSLTSINLAQGNFLPTQLLVSSDGANAYLLTSNRGGVLVFSVGNRTTSGIPLTGNALPLRAALSPDGTLLFAAASDGMIHVLNTITGNDFQQLLIPTDVTNLDSGLCANVAFPVQTAVQITGATQNGSDTTYSYTLTSGQGLQLDANVAIQGMSNAGNNGTFTIGALSAGTFTVLNQAGVTATGQAGTGTLSFNCNPDLITLAP